MNFTYTIEYQNKQAQTVTVLYQHENERALPVVYVLNYPENATDEDIKGIILRAAPIGQWERAINSEEVDFQLGSFDATSTDVASAIEEVTEILTLEQLKEAKRREIDNWRVVAEQRGLAYSFGGIDDVVQVRHERDLTNINGRVSAALILKERGIEAPVLPFRAQSDTTYNMTPSEMIEMGMAVGEFTANQYMKAWALKELVEAAQTAEELESIAWDFEQ